MTRIPLNIDWKRRLTEAVTQRLLLKATAFVLAIVLWLIATAKEPTEDLVPVRFAPILDSSLSLRDAPPTIRALVAGRGEDLLKLYASPLTFRRAISTGVPDTLVIDLTPRDIEIPPELEGRVFVRAVQPSSVTLHFETTATRVVPVRSQILVTPATGPYAVRFEPDSVEVIGPRQAVARVDHVTTVRSTIPPDDSLPHLVDIDTARLSVRVRPRQVKAYVFPLSTTAAVPPAPTPESPGTEQR